MIYILCYILVYILVLRYIDLIHQRGQALFNAYNDMRKKLGDVRNEIAIIGRKNHDAEQTIKRFSIVLLLVVYILRKMIFTTLWDCFLGEILAFRGRFGRIFRPDIECGQAESGAGGLEESEQQDAGGAEPGEGPGGGDGEEGGGVQG